MRDGRTRVAHYDDLRVEPLADAGVIVARGKQRTSSRRLERECRVGVIVHQESCSGEWWPGWKEEGGEKSVVGRRGVVDKVVDRGPRICTESGTARCSTFRGHAG